MKQAQIVDSEWDDKAYLRYLPPHLQERYRESLDDPQLTHLVRQISLIDVRIKGLLENLDRQVLAQETIEADLREELPNLSDEEIRTAAKVTMSYLPENFIDHRTFKRFARLIDKVEEAQIDGRIRDADRAKRQLFDGIRAGRRDGDVWDQIQDAMEQRRRLTEAEERRLAQTQQTVTLDKVVMILGVTIEALKESVRRYVSDKELQQYILEDANQQYTKQLGIRHHPSSNERVVD